MAALGFSREWKGGRGCVSSNRHPDFASVSDLLDGIEYVRQSDQQTDRVQDRGCRRMSRVFPKRAKQPVNRQQLTIEQAFALALEHHQAGRYAEAEDIYRQIVIAVPDYA